MQTRRQRIETNSYYSSKRGASKQPIRRPYRKWLLFVALIGLVGFGLYRLALPLGETEIEMLVDVEDADAGTFRVRLVQE